ncbi:MAG: hypothetical protein KIT79_14665 [Deltaproteobacteria bacterium]|nr:hypothetical protein [Deltaproteobacteria bacterium]
MSATAAASAPPPVYLAGGQEASGLADMIHQYLSQNVADSEQKRVQAKSLSGEVYLEAAEDDICVKIRFLGDHIELSDVTAPAPDGASIRADFISVAHLTTGEQGPFELLVRRRIRARFRPGQIPFLVRVLQFMQIPPELMAPEIRERTFRRKQKVALAAAAASAAAAGGLYAWLN